MQDNVDDYAASRPSQISHKKRERSRLWCGNPSLSESSNGFPFVAACASVAAPIRTIAHVKIASLIACSPMLTSRWDRLKEQDFASETCLFTAIDCEPPSAIGRNPQLRRNKTPILVEANAYGTLSGAKWLLHVVLRCDQLPSPSGMSVLSPESDLLIFDIDVC